MSLVELMVSMSILTVVIAGSIASAILFAKIATAHENNADYHNEIRKGFERMSLDARNANSITDRTDRKFTLVYTDGTRVTYDWNKSKGLVFRNASDGSKDTAFSNVTNFDVLVGDADASDSSLDYKSDALGIEALAFGAADGKGGETAYELNDLVFTIRNG